MPVFWSLGVYNYDTDPGTVYQVGVSNVNANPGGFAAATAGSKITFPKPWRMRFVTGVSNPGQATQGRHKCPCAAANQALFVSGTGFSIGYASGAVAFTTQSRIGEKRTFRI